MRFVSDRFHNPLLSPDDGPLATVLNPDFAAPVLFVCEHASPDIPAALGDLGLNPADRLSHAVWDPGAGALTSLLSNALKAPAVLSRVSRLVYDCNRPPERDDAMPEKTEEIVIPGNRNLSQADRDLRTDSIYVPFHALVSDTLDQFREPPALVTIHSFSPTWFGRQRQTELGILHDADPAMALDLMTEAVSGLRTELNQPYSAADGVTHTLARHGTARGIRNVMIEVRNDLLATDAGLERMASVLATMLAPALASTRTRV